MFSRFIKSRSLFILASLLFIASALTACGSKTTTESGKSDGPTTTIEHAMGKTEIKGTPKKVVILTNEGTEALLALGVKPVGAVQSFTGKPWYDHIKGQMEGVKVVGMESEPSLETIASLKPDLIIGNKMRHEKVYEQLKAIAPTVYSESLRGDWKANFKFYAKVLNKESEGQKVLAQYDEKIAQLKGKLGDKLKNKVSMVRFITGDVRIYHLDSFSGVILKDLGFARPESQNKNDLAERGVGKERIPAMDGDYLFYFTYETGDNKATDLEKEWLKDPLFQGLNAVKNKKAFKVSDTIWNTAGGVLAANLMLDDVAKFFEVK
ncbi:iron complex transport system substrate-binding protein [Croceifilum oryzae]|uniref:Iron complex transport system substrate-binding protein n=1 Tax=Croceifilum oryzae TaxID=1553429 RepID=A0AAJ1WSV1_9BACL|nr:iron-siderophore ABC transporter substrate-binding protein [Croceifilum oryzae]MDQ0418120.1 iron complex transport system substrate-binding protein [Croceifilum oryzae]